jgi:hypothetical protein
MENADYAKFPRPQMEDATSVMALKTAPLVRKFACTHPLTCIFYQSPFYSTKVLSTLPKSFLLYQSHFYSTKVLSTKVRSTKLTDFSAKGYPFFELGERQF